MKKTITLLTMLMMMGIGIHAEESELKSLNALTTGWYRVKCTVGSYANRYLHNISTKIEHNQLNYIVGIQYMDMQTPPGDATYYIRFEKTEANQLYMQMANGMYVNRPKPTATVTPVALTPTYSNGFSFGSGGMYFTPMAIKGYAAVGESSGGGSIRYSIYPVDPAAEGLTPWKVTIIDGIEDSSYPLNNTCVTCTRSDISGLNIAYNNGYFFLPAGTTPANTEFNIDGATDGCTFEVNEAEKTITVAILSPLTREKISAFQCYETTGRGNSDPVLRIDVHPSKDGVTLTSLKASITGASNISTIGLYATEGIGYYAETPTKIAEVAASDNIELPLSHVMSSGLSHLWLVATVKDDAELESTIDAAITEVSYSYNSESETLDLAEHCNPAGAMKVYALQKYLFVSNTNNCRYYRIPAMILDKDGNIVVASDMRYNSNSDLGNHKIDVVSMRSEDGGRTWKDRAMIAVGDGSTTAGYGYGDAALALAPNGDIICIMAAGSKMYGYGMVSGAISVSSDNGKSWSSVRSLFSRNFTDEVKNLTNKHGFTNIFTTSGKGLTTKEGLVLYTVNARVPDDNTNYCYILSSNDNGQSWKIGKNVAYSGCDESKLEQLNDGSLLLSVRQSGNRGWNIGTADGAEWGTQYRTADISGNACNADILYYSRSTEGQPDILLHSYIKSSSRENLTLAMSIDGGKNWADVQKIVKGASCYSTMVKLNDGTLAILFEDQTYSDGYGYAINYLTITQEQVLAWYDELKQKLMPSEAVVKIAVQGSTTGTDTYGSYATTGWTNLWTSNTASGKSGLTISAGHKAFEKATIYGQRVLALKASAAKASDVITITAPEGYVINDFSIGGYAMNTSDTYTLISSDGTMSVMVNKTSGTPDQLTVTDINARQATFTLKSNVSNSNYACISNFNVGIKASDEGNSIIDTLSSSQSNTADATIHNLVGQRVTTARKGIYIVGRKKVLAK